MSHLVNPKYSGTAQTEMGTGAIWYDMPNNINESGKGWMEYYEPSQMPKHSSTSGGAVTTTLGRYSAYLDQGGFIRPLDGTGQAAAVDGGFEIGSDGDNELVAISTMGRALLAGTAPALWFECEIKTNVITSAAPGIFIGLTEAFPQATNLMLDDNDAVGDKNCFGFHKLEGTGVWGAAWKADGQTAQAIAAVATPVADTYVRLGFKLIPRNPVAKRIVFYVNGVPFTTYVTTTNMAAATFPSDICMGFGLTVNNATGSTPGYATWKWARLAQAAY